MAVYGWWRASVAAVFGLSAVLVACAPEAAAPEDARPDAIDAAPRLSLAHLDKLQPALQAEVDARLRPGFVALVLQGDAVVHQTVAGFADIETQSPIGPNTRFRLASMSKPIISVAALKLVEEGRLLLGDPVSRFLPEFKDKRVVTSTEAGPDEQFPAQPTDTPITIHNLLTHMAGLGYPFDPSTDLGKMFQANNLYHGQGPLAERIAQLADMPLYEEPGTLYRYSYATDVLGRVLEVVTGQSLEAYLKAAIFDPLGMNDTAFFVDETDLDGAATVYYTSPDGALAPSPGLFLGLEPNAQGFGWMSGGGGLISSAADYARFVLMLMNAGTYQGARILSPASVRLLRTKSVPDAAEPAAWAAIGRDFGLGVSIAEEPGLAGRTAALGEYGWPGYYGTFFAISPVDDLAYIVMTQYEPGANYRSSRANALVGSIVYGSLEYAGAR
ncbi:MAG: serine hydrolase domain-containing protein [Pseudomonadota bacterium]